MEPRSLQGRRLCGVAIVGRPTGRRLDDGNTLEVTRLCTDGTRNACSALYAACARRAKREGYGKIITFTLQSEPGTSLKAAGWTLEAEKAGTKVEQAEIRRKADAALALS